jgi:hypothetical protein
MSDFAVVWRQFKLSCWLIWEERWAGVVGGATAAFKAAGLMLGRDCEERQ